MEIIHKIIIMKKLTQGIAIAALLFGSAAVSAQQKSTEDLGFLTYCLPATSIVMDVEAQQETFYAGPYAKYAEKYLGIKVRQKDATTVTVTSLSMTPYVEADQSRRYSIQVKKGDIDATFLKLSSAGLVSFADANFGEGTMWRFPKSGGADFSGKGISSNLTSEYTTLYKSDEHSNGTVAVQQSVIVEKTPEKKAAETAEMILKLRKQRLQIVTGDTDATYSGAAMGAAIAELTRLEQEYMTLFTGYSEFKTQKMKFEVVPQSDKENQMYIAFRLSDTAGLVPAENLSGKPVVMEIVPQNFSEPVVEAAEKDKKAVLAHYRIPAMCQVKVLIGQELLMQTRIPIYQLGQECVLPVNTIISK